MGFDELLNKINSDIEQYETYDQCNLIEDKLAKCLKSYISNLNIEGAYYIIQEVR